MKIAAIYDIHANLHALQAVLKEIEAIEVDLIFVGGDVVTGPLPRQTLDLLQSLNTPTEFILGNAESEVLRHLRGEAIGGLSERANEEARWSSRQLTKAQQEFIASWPATAEFELEGLGKVLFCHGTPRSDIEVFTKETPPDKLRQMFKEVDNQVVICGHTHMQFDIEIDGACIVNAGSVGMPFGKTGADWMLMDGAINFMHTHYDLEEAASLIRASDYPYAASFAANNVLNSPSEADALKMLAKLEALQST